MSLWESTCHTVIDIMNCRRLAIHWLEAGINQMNCQMVNSYEVFTSLGMRFAEMGLSGPRGLLKGLAIHSVGSGNSFG